MTEPTTERSQRPTMWEEHVHKVASADESPDRPWPHYDQPRVVVRELMALLLVVVLCDLTIYRGHGFAGYAALFLSMPLLLLLGTVRLKFDRSGWVLMPLLLLLALRLVWCGSWLAMTAGFVLLCGFAMSLAGLRPYVLQAAVFAAHLISAGHRGLHHYSQSLARFSPKILRANWLAVMLPAVTLVVFGTIFVLANPDLVKSFSSGFTQIVESLERWLENFQATEILFCIGVGWLAVGLLRPDPRQVTTSDGPVYVAVEPVKSPLYEAFRNTLVMVIGLFAVYLVFEFQTLWFRVFPKGFHYSGYAHEGAAWLTVALALATVMLSVIFRGSILDDPRRASLRRLAWVWSIENLILAAAVFNRLFIYVGFNGMTRMRVIGLLGAASVVGGFLLVVWKIAHNRSFVWLIRRQLWVVSFAAYLYAVLPVDAFVNQYNVSRILAGDPAPSVQISVHPTSSEGLLCLNPLLDCSDEIIRDGVEALLYEKLVEASQKSEGRRRGGWTAIQIADERLLNQLLAEFPNAFKLLAPEPRAAALKKFHEYAYQWY